MLRGLLLSIVSSGSITTSTSTGAGTRAATRRNILGLVRFRLGSGGVEDVIGYAHVSGTPLPGLLQRDGLIEMRACLVETGVVERET